MVCNYFLFEYLLFINIPIYKYFLFINIPFINILFSNITLKIFPYQHFGMLWYSTYQITMISIVRTHIIDNRLYITSYITIYENNKITVEESSRIPPTCLPASTDVTQHDYHHFQFDMNYSDNRINI